MSCLRSPFQSFVPSQADTAVFESLKGAPEAAHALRWYNHIKSFGAGMKQFAKASKDAATYISGGGAAAVADAGADDDEEDEDVDLFGSDEDDEDDEAKAKVVEERLKAYHAKKAKKPALIAKTSVLLDVKPWDDETDMDEMLKQIKTITKEGLV